MGKRRPERDQAKEIWEKSGGKKSIRELSGELGVSEGQLRKWKSEDKWTAKKPRGAPKGNQNAKGRKNPSEPVGLGNKNAQTHGAYAQPVDAAFTPEEKTIVDSIQDGLLRDQVRKYFDLQHKIADLEQEETERFVTGGIDGANPIEYWDAKIKWLETLEKRSDRIAARIQKSIDQQQAARNAENNRRLAELQLKFQREKAMGVFDDGSEEDTPED